ncbi:sodium channel modifier 1 [Gouania willdenowi]|uniref:Sodium channel modifier 1 n=1 Tax=Gouania willdenowi TaxID=441366 RepID=A0A8C5HDB7_GOUWI|nr:sodium channel modifier 1 [Gouania willdenowi]
MSFKREGDDKSQLNILKKRRVADLLANFIPDDEASLLSNGRYTCLVCSYRPVFDTVDTLTVHRQGKKHIEGLKAFYGKKSRLKNEKTKKMQESFVEAEDKEKEQSSSAPLLAQTRKITHHALLKTVPYNSCHRRTSTRSESGAASTSTDVSRKVCNTIPFTYRNTEVSHDLSTCTSRDCTTANTESHSSQRLTESQEEASLPMTDQRKQELERYLKLKSDGWLQDRSGQWVKDENAEFDSDEDDPDLSSKSKNQELDTSC